MKTLCLVRYPRNRSRKRSDGKANVEQRQDKKKPTERGTVFTNIEERHHLQNEKVKAKTIAKVLVQNKEDGRYEEEDPPMIT